MEFLDDNPELREEAARLLQKFRDQTDRLKRSDMEAFRRRIEEAPDVESKSERMRHLIEENVPASIDVLEWLLKRSEKDPLLHLEWLSHRQHAAMSVETFVKAREISEQANELAKKLYLLESPGTSDEGVYKAYIKACVNLLLVCRYQGKLSDAEVYLEEAQKVADTEQDTEGRHLLLILKGDLLLARGLLNTAIDTVFTPLLQEPLLTLANKGLLLQKFGNACRSAARWGLAKDYLRQSISIAYDLEDTISEYDRMTDLGNVYRSEGRIADALKYQLPHMAFAFKRGDLWGMSVACFNMGFAYYSVSPRPELKRALILLSLKHDLSALVGNEPLKGMALNNLGKTFCALGQYEGAVRVMMQSLDIARKTLNVAGEGMAYGNIGTAYRSLGKYDAAIEYHKKYLENALARGDDGGAAIMQRELAIDYLCKGDLESAEEQARTAISTLETIREKLGGEDTSKIANFDKNQSETYSLLQVILCRRQKYAEALALSEMGRSRALTDLIRDKLLQTTEAAERGTHWIYTSDFVDRWQDLAQDIQSDFVLSAQDLRTNFLVYSVLKEYDDDGSARHYLYIWLVLNALSAKGGKDRIHFRKMALSEKIQSELLVDYGFFSSLTRSFAVQADEGVSSAPKTNEGPTVEEEKSMDVRIPEGPEVEELLQLLEFPSISDEKVVEAANTNRDSSHPVDRSHAPEQEKISTEEERVDIILERMLELGSWKVEGIKQLQQLYDLCVAPVADLLPEEEDGGSVPSITILPHEFLFGVPFCCLRDRTRKDKRYLVERFEISYAPSLRALHLLNKRLEHLRTKQAGREMKVLAMGHAVMSLPDVRELPSSGEEAENVREVFGPDQCRLALRGDATKQLMLQGLRNVDILHVATHASPQDVEGQEKKPAGDYSMRGCVLLSKSGEKCDGVVKASEIAAVDCRCQLVTLSCCETGLGKVTGDGVVGLYRAFFAAGAASVLVTLWKIRDDVARLFMEHFYKEFKETGSVSGSLRSTMVYCIREKKLPPQQWAAFSHVGAAL